MILNSHKLTFWTNWPSCCPKSLWRNICWLADANELFAGCTICNWTLHSWHRETQRHHHCSINHHCQYCSHHIRCQSNKMAFTLFLKTMIQIWLDRSQPLFYFEPQEKDSHIQAGSTRSDPGLFLLFVKKRRVITQETHTKDRRERRET